MATTGRTEESTSAAGVAASCRDADFVGLVGAPNGDALAGLALLATALDDIGTPFHARIGATGSDDVGGDEPDVVIAVGQTAPGVEQTITAGHDRSASERAYAVAAELEAPDLALALAGRIAAGRAAAASPLADDAERRPGVAVPTTDLADGLAHTTLVHTPFSGDREATSAALADLEMADERDDDDHRRVASHLAMAVTGDEATPPRAATAVERVLRPHIGGPLRTIGGHADVLDATARASPGLGLAVALGAGGVDEALDVWRDVGQTVHHAVEAVALESHDGFAVGQTETDHVTPVARLVRDFRSPEPVVLLTGPERTALATSEDGPDAHAILATAATDGHHVHGDARLASARIDEPTTVITALEAES